MFFLRYLPAQRHLFTEPTTLGKLLLVTGHSKDSAYYKFE
jgi:hypothetical protein